MLALFGEQMLKLASTINLKREIEERLVGFSRSVSLNFQI